MGHDWVMGHVRRFDHVGITVSDLDAAVGLFEALGLEAGARRLVEGEFIETVCGIPGARCEVVGLSLPDGGTWLEVARFVHPDHVPGLTDPPANQVGIRNVCFEVDDINAAVDTAAELGYGLVSGIGEYEGTWKMAYVRGPEGIVVNLTQRVG
jgi:catechol 2,3-dioxygenase-like lactoylglutathione lyase family enzyme